MTDTDTARPSGDTSCRSRLYGLDIASAINLYSRRSASVTNTDVWVTLREPAPVSGDVPAGELQVQWSTPDGLRASFVRTATGDHLLRFQSTCEVVIDASATRISLRMAEGVPVAMGSVLIAGTVLSYLLMLRDAPVLHASAVQIDGRAIAFVGSSGMGKTTLATLLCRAGGNLITDDVLRLGRADGGAYGCYLGATELRLREAAAGLASDFGDSGSHRTTADARRALSVPIASQERSPLAALIVPRPRRDLDAIELTRLQPRDAAIGLLSFPRILGICAPVLLSRAFVQATDIAEAVPMFVADVPWGPPFAEDLPKRLLDRIDEAVAAHSP